MLLFSFIDLWRLLVCFKTIFEYRFTGTFLFIEASREKQGDKARLLSRYFKSMETVCLQFWYHMYGKDTGKLNVYVKTNQTEQLVWSEAGDKGDEWLFGQTALSANNTFQVKIILICTPT